MRCEDPPTHTHPPLSQKFPEEVPGNPSPRKEEKGGGEGKKNELNEENGFTGREGGITEMQEDGALVLGAERKEGSLGSMGPSNFPTLKP